MIHHDPPEFGEIRSLLHQPPSEEAWGKLCRLIDRWDEGDLHTQIIPYVLSNLRRWPAHLRLAQPAWLDLELAGAKPPQWQLVRAIACDGRVLDYTLCQALNQRLITHDIVALQARNTHIESREMQQFVNEEAQQHLRLLDWSQSSMDEVSLHAFAHAIYYTQLHTLRFNDSPLGNQGVATLCQAPNLPSLHTLELRNTRIGLLGLEELGHATFTTQLTHLDLSDNHLGSRGAAALVQRHVLGSLHQLTLKNCMLGVDGAEALAQATPHPHLTHLNLEHNNLRSDGVEKLSESPLLTYVTHLDLGYNRIGDDGIEALIDSDHTTHLTHLKLHWNPVSSRAATMLDEAGISHDLTEADWSKPQWA